MKLTCSPFKTAAKWFNPRLGKCFPRKLLTIVTRAIKTGIAKNIKKRKLKKKEFGI